MVEAIGLKKPLPLQYCVRTQVSPGPGVGGTKGSYKETETFEEETNDVNIDVASTIV